MYKKKSQTNSQKHNKNRQNEVHRQIKCVLYKRVLILDGHSKIGARVAKSVISSVKGIFKLKRQSQKEAYFT